MTSNRNTNPSVKPLDSLYSLTLILISSLFSGGAGFLLLHMSRRTVSEGIGTMWLAGFALQWAAFWAIIVVAFKLLYLDEALPSRPAKNKKEPPEPADPWKGKLEGFMEEMKIR